MQPVQPTLGSVQMEQVRASFPGIFPFHLESRSAEVTFLDLSYEKSFPG